MLCSIIGIIIVIFCTNDLHVSCFYYLIIIFVMNFMYNSQLKLPTYFMFIEVCASTGNLVLLNKLLYHLALTSRNYYQCY